MVGLRWRERILTIVFSEVGSPASMLISCGYERLTLRKLRPRESSPPPLDATGESARDPPLAGDAGTAGGDLVCSLRCISSADIGSWYAACGSESSEETEAESEGERSSRSSSR